MAHWPEHIHDGFFHRISDFHLLEQNPVCLRMDGALQAVDGAEVITRQSFLWLLAPVLPDAVAEALCKGDFEASDFTFTLEGNRYRCNVFTSLTGYAAAIRVLARAIPAPDQLGFPEPRIPAALCRLRHGLVLMTGATGSGKSTTIASLVQAILDTMPKRIITLEDPIEHVFQSRRGLISQRQLGNHLSSFGRGIRSAMREDPDVIVVGEIRDEDTVRLALTAAETGHLVFATLHTRDVVGSLPRLIDLGPREAQGHLGGQLAMILQYIIGHTLIEKVGGGRVQCMEILQNSRAVANHIRSQRWDQMVTSMQTSNKEGMWTLDGSLRKLLAEKKITEETALGLAEKPEDIRGRNQKARK